MLRRHLVCTVLALLAAAPVAAKDKLGPLATPIFAATEYLRTAPAPDYWAYSPFYVAQSTGSNCSVAAIVVAVNGLRGLPRQAEIPVITQAAILDAVPDRAWKAKTAESGPGITFAEFAAYARMALDASGLAEARMRVVRPVAANEVALAAFRAALAENEATVDNVMLIAFNQGVVTGDWDGPHASPVGAYDAANDRVLILDVDREWYVPYWTDTATLLAAMVKPAPPEQGVLAGDRGGWILVSRTGGH